MITLSELNTTLSSLKQAKPLVLCLTNYVTMDFMANSLLALGAAPLMTQALDEIEELVSLSQAVTINLGTLDKSFCERAQFAARRAKAQKKTLILDPVGAGASELRTKAAKDLLPYSDIVRANASEILALVDEVSDTKGVETSRTVSQAMRAAKKLAGLSERVVVVSGPIDFLTEGSAETRLPFGSPLMPLITGMGCALTAVIAAFTAIKNNAYEASLYATAYFGLCGQLANMRAQDPGTFRQLFIDALFRPDWTLMSELLETTKIEEIE